MIDQLTNYVVTAGATITATAALGSWRSLQSMADRIETADERSKANQRRQIGEPDDPETLDAPILDRVRQIERQAGGSDA